MIAEHPPLWPVRGFTAPGKMIIIDGRSGCRTCHAQEPDRVQIFVKCWKHSQAASAPANAVTSERFTAR
jgi:hypothetical protein